MFVRQITQAVLLADAVVHQVYNYLMQFQFLQLL
jgi:hypothetical protein